MTSSRLSRKKEVELRLIAELTVDATLAVEEKLSRLANRKASRMASQATSR